MTTASRRHRHRYEITAAARATQTFFFRIFLVMLCGTPTTFRHPARKSVRDCAVVRLCAEEGAPGRRFSGTRHCTPVAREWMCVHLPVAAGWARVHRVSCAILPHGCGAGRLSCPFKSLFRFLRNMGGRMEIFPDGWFVDAPYGLPGPDTILSNPTIWC
jgi:hypothetical protein